MTLQQEEKIPAPNAAVALAPSTQESTLDIQIRSYRSEDYEIVREMFAEGLFYYCPPGTNDGLREYTKRSLRLDMADIEGTYFASGGHFWVAVITDERGDEKIIGSVALEAKEDNRGELRRLSVRDGYRRHGLARKLVAHLENWARDNGFKAVFLNTGTTMPDAIKFYNALGYTHTHTKVVNTDPYVALLFYEVIL